MNTANLDDNDRLQAGVLPGDPQCGTRVLRPSVVNRPDIAGMVDEVERLLAALDPQVYQRGSRLVQLVHAPRGDSGDGGQMIVEMTAANLVDRLTRVADFQDGSGRPGEPRRSAVKACVERREYPNVRTLDGLAEFPVLRPDGSVLSASGYDPMSRLFLTFDQGPLELSVEPTRREARSSLSLLEEVVSDFPFATDAARAGWIAAVLTVLGRPAIDGPVPLFLIDANARGAGKTKLAQLVSWIVRGEAMSATPYSGDEQETRKLLTTIALGGRPLVLLDNLTGKLQGGALEAALTSTRWHDRLLGSNEAADLPFRVVMLASANNVAVSPDMLRRSVYVRLDSCDQRPELRDEYRHPDLEGWVRSERPRLLAAALTVLRAYVVAGSPAQRARPMGGYEAWSRLVRGALLWAGGVDPSESGEELRDASVGEQEAARGTIMDAIEQMVRAKGLDPRRHGVMARELLDASRYGLDQPGAVPIEGLADAIDELSPARGSGGPTPKTVGRMLFENRDVVVGDRRIERVGRCGSGGTSLWGVREVRR